MLVLDAATPAKAEEALCSGRRESGSFRALPIVVLRGWCLSFPLGGGAGVRCSGGRGKVQVFRFRQVRLC